jgi:CheY-like chemotaxis protein
MERIIQRNKEVIILVAEDDEGHAELIQLNLKRAGIANEIRHFRDGQAILDYLFRRTDPPHWESGDSFVLLLDIRMPKVDGTEVLRQLKTDPELKKVPVIMVTTTDDPREVALCHQLGCSSYITKPVEYETFVNAIRQLGLFLTVVQIHRVGNAN